MASKYDKHLKEFFQAGAILREIEYDRLILDDKPDIIIEVGGKRIGLEMTECHASSILSNNKQSRQKAIKRCDKICKKYKEILEARGEKNIIVFIGFTSELYEVLSKRKYDNKIIQEVLDAIDIHRRENEIRAQSGDTYKQWLIEEFVDYTHHKYVDSATFYKAEGFFEVSQVISTLSTTVEAECINHCIADKDAKLTDYKMKHPNIDEYWLGIYFTDNSERFFDYLTGYKCRETGYNKIYLLERRQKIQVK